MATVGGTTSVIAGGKFANGAVSGAFVHMFNAEGRRLISQKNGKFIQLKEEKYTYTSKAERFSRFVDSFEVSRSDFQGGLRNVASVGLCVVGTVASGGTAYLAWGASVAIDGYNVYNSGDLTNGAGSVVGFPENGKIGGAGAVGISIYNAF